MSDNRGHDWLDDATAERLLRGAHGDDPAEGVWRDDRAAALAGLLAAAAAPAPIDPEREEAAVAAFRAARGDDALAAAPAAVRLCAADARPAVGGAGAVRKRWSRTARRSRSLTGTLVATAAVAGMSVAAAAAGALPALLDRPAPAPAHTQVAAPVVPVSASPSPTPTALSASASPDPGHDRPTGGGTHGTRDTHGTVAPGHSFGPPSAPALDHTALCRAFEAAGRHHKNVDEQVYQRLREAAGGGQGTIRRYCAGLLGESGNPGTSGNAGKAGEADTADTAEKTEKTEKAKKAEETEKKEKKEAPADDDSRDGGGRHEAPPPGHDRQEDPVPSGTAGE